MAERPEVQGEYAQTWKDRLGTEHGLQPVRDDQTKDGYVEDRDSIVCVGKFCRDGQCSRFNPAPSGFVSGSFECAETPLFPAEQHRTNGNCLPRVFLLPGFK